MVKDMTKGNPMKIIIRFCLPLMLGNLFQQFYNMADTIIVGKFVGKTALSAVGSVGALNFLVIGSIIGLCTGFAIQIAQSFGAQNFKKLRKITANIIYTGITTGVILTILAVVFTKPLLRVLNTPDDIFTDAYNYIVIVFAGIGATMLYNILAGIIRSLGDSKTPLYFLIFSSFLNIGLDLLFIIVFKMGVKGASIATVLSELVIVIIQFQYIKKQISFNDLLKMAWKYFTAGMIMFAVCFGVKFVLATNLINSNLVELAKSLSMEESYLINSVSIITQMIFGIITYFGILIALKDDYVFKFIDKIKSRIFKKKEVEN